MVETDACAAACVEACVSCILCQHGFCIRPGLPMFIVITIIINLPFL